MPVLRSLSLLSATAALAIPGCAAAPHLERLATGDLVRGAEWYLTVPATSDPAAPDKPATCQLYIYEVGEGPPLVILHGGFGAEHSYLLGAFDGLERHRRLVFFDQRGSLRSPCPLPSLTYDALVEDVERIREALGAPRLDLFGHSMGSMLAMSYLQRHPDRVGRMILSGALPPVITEVPRDQTILERLTKRPELETARAKRRAEGPARSLGTDLWRIDFASVNLWHVDRWRQMRGGKVFYNPTAGSTLVTDAPETDARAALRAHPYPITYLQGDVDYVDAGCAKTRQLLAGARNVRFVVLPHAGHAAWIDDPDGYRHALEQALR